MQMAKKVLVAMSGGVDSSVSAAILQEQGYEVYGATMKLFANETIGIGREKTCCSLKDAEDARFVCQRLGIPHYVFNFTKDFQKYVIEPFGKAYEDGETPNPCLECNRFLKFQRFLQRALLLDFDYIATGHYARRQYDAESQRYQLKKALDPKKDQSYMLYTMRQQELEKTLFPLGELTKNQVRELARKWGFANAQKKDSQDICFVPNGNYGAFLEENLHIKSPKGVILNNQGEKIGEHKGIIHYTIGQRRRIGLACGKPVYVIEKNAAENTITVGDEALLYRNKTIVKNVNLLSVAALTEPVRVKAKTRYKQPETDAVIFPLAKGDFAIVFAKPQKALAKGQAAVFYVEDTVLGGGTIC